MTLLKSLTAYEVNLGDTIKKDDKVFTIKAKSVDLNNKVEFFDTDGRGFTLGASELVYLVAKAKPFASLKGIK